MDDKGKVIAGLIIFFVILTFPLWFNHGAASSKPEPELTEKAKKAETCVAETEFMRTDHMALLDEWRDTVVRDGKRMYVSKDGKQYAASLSDTCLDCHSNKAEFCDRCHEYASVSTSIYCWECHTYPEEDNNG